MLPGFTKAVFPTRRLLAGKLRRQLMKKTEALNIPKLSFTANATAKG